MKTFITPNLIKYTLSALILTVIFRTSMSASITNKMALGITITAIVYGITMWLSGYYFGKKEHEYLPIYDIGFRFHISTFLIHNIISFLWFTLGFAAKTENIKTVYSTALIWSIFIIIHFLYYLFTRKSSIKNLDKKSLFE